MLDEVRIPDDRGHEQAGRVSTTAAVVAVAGLVLVAALAGLTRLGRDDGPAPGSPGGRATDPPAAAEPSKASPAPWSAHPDRGMAPAATASPYGIWPYGRRPTSRIHRSDSARTVGTRFRVQQEGTVVALRYYGESSHLGRVVGQLHTADGQLLGRAVFGTSDRPGWHQKALGTPVRLRAGRSYVVSYVAPRGHVSYRPATFGDGRVIRTGALVAVAGRTVAGSGFPTSTSRSAFFADVAFRPRPAFPTASTTGVPANWTPTRTVTGDVTIDTPGEVVEDLRVTDGSIIVAAPDVTLRRVEVLGGTIGNWVGPTCSEGLRIERSTVARAPGQPTSGADSAISTGGYTAVRVKIDGLPEGFRVGGQPEGCGPVVIRGSYVKVTAPDICGDWHGDGLQGWEGPALTVRNTRMILEERDDCGGTAPFFYPDQGNTSVDIDGLLVQGGGYPFRLGTPGVVRDLKIVTGFYYGPIDVKCSLLEEWDAEIVELGQDEQPVRVRDQPCNT
jgi:hypothetical protein